MNRMDNGQADETITSETVTEMKTEYGYGDHPNVRNTRLEEAAHQLVLFCRNISEGKDSERAAYLRDLCNNVDDAIAVAQSAVMPVPALLEVTGNVEEKELAARYMEQKEAACRTYAKRNSRLAGEFEQAAEMFRVTASDFRNGLHLPEIHVSGRVIPYNDTLDTGLRHEDNLRRFFEDVHARNVKAGWWTDIDTSLPLKRSVGEMFILIVTELVEAYNAWCHGDADDKLPHYPGVGVEIGDLLIRVADFCGGLYSGRIIEPSPHVRNPGDEMFREIAEVAMRYELIRKTPAAVGDPEIALFLPPMDVAPMIDEKLAFNASRPDHKIENRLKEDGKRT